MQLDVVLFGSSLAYLIQNCQVRRMCSYDCVVGLVAGTVVDGAVRIIV